MEKLQNVFVDWEMAGVGSGAQDLAQYLISHMDPAERKTNENFFLHEYFETFNFYLNLNKGSNSSSNSSEHKESSMVYTFEKFKQDFVHGGVERWIWLLILLSSMCSDKMVRFFHDQVLAFVMDHVDVVNVDTVGMPRV
jgi:thiamine kinase-like enzyme